MTAEPTASSSPAPADASRRRDQGIEQVIAVVLQVGVVVSLVVAVAGGLLFLGQEGRHLADYAVFRGEPFDLRHPGAIVAAAFAGQRDAVVQLGVLILIATPIARVLLSLVAFAVQRDRVYTLVTAIVLCVLLVGLLGVVP